MFSRLSIETIFGFEGRSSAPPPPGRVQVNPFLRRPDPLDALLDNSPGLVPNLTRRQERGEGRDTPTPLSHRPPG